LLAQLTKELGKGHDIVVNMERHIEHKKATAAPSQPCWELLKAQELELSKKEKAKQAGEANIEKVKTEIERKQSVQQDIEKEVADLSVEIAGLRAAIGRTRVIVERGSCQAEAEMPQEGARGLETLLPSLGRLREDSELKSKMDSLLKKIHEDLAEASRLIKEEADRDFEKDLEAVPPAPLVVDEAATEVDDVVMGIEHGTLMLKYTIDTILGESATEEAKRKAREAIEAFTKRPRHSPG